MKKLEGNFLYHQYLKVDSEHYGKIRKGEGGDLKVEGDIKSMYSVHSDEESVWTHYQVEGVHLPTQGWKIHITSSKNDAQKVLNKIARVCMERNLVFKHLKDRQSFMKMNSKNANRASSGKFITVYPLNEEQFVELLDVFADATKDYEKGPYILNDKRWKDSNVFYRYGGFKTILNEDGEHCIYDDTGQLIPDQRNPFYQVPPFMEPYDAYLDSLNVKDDLLLNEETTKLNDYNIETSLSYSNAGGVYLATKKATDEKVIIKEARPVAGLDGIGRDALERQKIELDALTTLNQVPGVVNVLDHFQAWEHYFIVEEYIEGSDLRSWLVRNYPFAGSVDLNVYGEEIVSIMTNLYHIIDDMHQKGIAMGDIQPANVILTSSGEVKLIDFETAVSVYSTEKPGMATTGFVSQEIKVAGARDWFGYLKLLRYISLPILTSDTLEKYLAPIQLNWIKNQYPSHVYKQFIDLFEKANNQIRYYQNDIQFKWHLEVDEQTEDLQLIVKKLVKGLGQHVTDDERFINGDIRQYELKDAKFNILNGGSGAALTLNREGHCVEKIDKWMNTYLLDQLPDVQNVGLFSGLAGISTLLYERGHTETVQQVIRKINQTDERNDLTLRSGLSGVGLFYISIYLETNKTEYLDYAENVAEKIAFARKTQKSLKTNDWSAVPIGLIDGVSGISLFYAALYSVTSNEDYLCEAIELIKEDLAKTQKDEESGILQTLDENNRLLPYLSGGSIGIGIAIWFLNHVSDQQLFKEEFDSILNLSKIRCTISGGLFDGAGGFLLLPSLVEDRQAQLDYTKDVIELAHLFLIEKEDTYIYPGNFSYRLSDDVFSGSSGIILAFQSIMKENPLYWLPLINVENFVASTRGSRLKEVH
ncbi:class III lanthionine synthetase LanKC [Shouchella miscanthi]|uniref:class III lanthionine synthetase LanKC n=1 Tax=Shouchella miscanthi TaxID=2598861 RepID=UPI0011A1B188|nr:class III lanthionine synthetase LanKC [Shouchella miscanthi]